MVFLWFSYGFSKPTRNPQPFPTADPLPSDLRGFHQGLLRLQDRPLEGSVARAARVFAEGDGQQRLLG